MKFEEFWEIRKQIHMYPETKWTEFLTTDRICLYLESWGYHIHFGKDIFYNEFRHNLPSNENIENSFKRAAKLGARKISLEKMRGGFTGVIAQLDSGKPGPVIGYRADIDALPIHESKKTTHIPTKEGWNSQFEGVMHACGHDVHITIALGIARFVSENIDRLNGKFVFFFSPAEEQGKGCTNICQHPVLLELQYLFVIHTGNLNFLKKPTLAPYVYYRSIHPLRIRFKSTKYSYIQEPKGMESILSQKDLTKREQLEEYFKKYNSMPNFRGLPIKAACVFINTIDLQPERHDGQVFLDFEFVKSQIATNLTEECELIVNIRADTIDLLEHKKQQIMNILQQISMIFDINYSIETIPERTLNPLTENHPKLVEVVVKEWINLTKSEDDIIDIPYKEAGNDDAQFLMDVVKNQGGKTIYFLVLSGNPDGNMANVHAPEGNFDITKDTLDLAIQLMINVYERLCFSNTS